MAKQTYETDTGVIEFTLKNNYMFQLVLQNLEILKGLLCSLLDLRPEEIKEIRILNPVALGDDFDAKTFIMDIFILLNNAKHINLEMQVENEDNWPDRSLNYLCRSYDNLMKGENYKDVRAAIHIGIVDFDVFPDQPEFYSDNKIMNTKSHKIYNDKFQLRVLSLKQIQLATEEDKAAGRDRWAGLFRARTWEELKMAAAQNPVMNAAAQKLYDANGDFIARERARAVEDYQRRERRAQLIEQEYKEATEALEKANLALAEKDAAITEKDAAIAEKDAVITKNATMLAEKEAENALLRAQLEKFKQQNA